MTAVPPFRQPRVPAFDPIYRDDGESEMQFPRSHYTRSTAITEARQEADWLFEDHRRSELEAVASAVRYATEADYEDGFHDIDHDMLGSYLLWCSPKHPDAIPSWLVRVRR